MKPAEIRAALDNQGGWQQGVKDHMKARGLTTRLAENVWHYWEISGNQYPFETDPKWFWLKEVEDTYSTEDYLLEDYFENYMEN